MKPDYYNLYLGIDPGLQGALAFVSHEGDVISASPLPTRTIRDKKQIDSANLYHMIKAYVDNIRFTSVEHVHAMPKQGVVSTFSFGKGFGMILSILEVLNLRYNEPTPQAWKKDILGQSTPDKAKSLAYAMSVPMKRDFVHIRRGLTPHDGVADAICLARYARKYYKENLRGRYE